MSETEIFLNGEKLSGPEELNQLMNQWQEAMIAEQAEIQSEFGVSQPTAGAIQYLRSRSRWTPEKELQLIARDLLGDPIPLENVLSGEF